MIIGDTASFHLSALLSFAYGFVPLVTKWSNMAAGAPDITSKFQVAARRKRGEGKGFLRSPT